MQLLDPKTGYMDLKAIREDGVTIYWILGQRADGKTYGVLQDSIKKFFSSGIPSAYIRRFDESLKRATMQDLCKPHNKLISSASKKKYYTSVYKSRRFYPATSENGKTVPADMPFLYCYSLNTWETDKGADSGHFYNVIFDECISASKYLPNEYQKFENVLSSIIRNRSNTTLWMLSNPINQICPYFDEFDIQPHKLKPGDVVYRISQHGYKLKFVYLPPMSANTRQIHSIFDFKKNNSSITSGYWEFGEFPHLPSGMSKQAEKIGEFAIMYRNQFAICEFYYLKSGLQFCFWRPGNDEKILSNDSIPLFTDAHLFTANSFTAWTHGNLLSDFYDDCVKSNRQYFSDNKVGNLVKQWYTDFVRTAGRFGL